MSAVVKYLGTSLIILVLLSGCLTIHNLNVVSDNNPPGTPVAIPVLAEDGQARGADNSPVPVNGTRVGNAQSPEALDAMGNPVAPDQSLMSVKPEYVIHSGDTFDVKFFYNPELNESVKVRPDGRISLQLVQDVQAASLTPSELVSVLKKKYASHIKDPEISVIVRSFDANRVYVDGQVVQPGVVEMSDGMTIMDAVASVRGLRETARPSEVLLIRRNGLKRPFVYLVDLDAAMSGADITQNVTLRPYDIVYVPKSAIANINTWIDQYIRRNIPIYMGVSFESIKFK
jgi:protein involved in polysaccharide export with SLBB domain